MVNNAEFTDQEVPDGFVSSDLIQTLEGPFTCADGRITDGPAVAYDWGTQYVYDDGRNRIVVRCGDRETYSAAGYYMEIETLAGKPGQHFDNIHTALSTAYEASLRIAKGA